MLVSEYVLQYHELSSQHNPIYNRNAFGSLNMSYLRVSKNTAQEIIIVCIMVFCQICKLDWNCKHTRLHLII